jgi:RimJ/RimL family protein N-acetyltransferase
VLTDGVITLAVMTAGAAAALVAGEDDDIVRRLAGGPATPASAQRHIRERAEDWRGDWYRGGTKLAWGVRDDATGTLAGTAEVQLVQPELPAGAANLSYSVFPPWRGRGFGSRAVALMCAFLAARTTATLAVLRIDADNAASLRVAERSGFRPAQELAGPRASMRWFAHDLRTRPAAGLQSRMFCPTCGLDMYWVVADDDPVGGWWQCDDAHRWRRAFGGFAPLDP